MKEFDRYKKTGARLSLCDSFHVFGCLLLLRSTLGQMLFLFSVPLFFIIFFFLTYPHRLVRAAYAIQKRNPLLPPSLPPLILITITPVILVPLPHFLSVRGRASYNRSTDRADPIIFFLLRVSVHQEGRFGGRDF